MHKRHVLSTLILACFVLLANSASASQAVQDKLNESFAAGGPGAAAIVVKGDEVLFSGARGMASIELDVPLEVDSVFRLGSISKQFTAAGILLLEQQGKLKVTDDIHQYLPDYPTHGHVITIEHLLTHTSGIFNLTNIPGYFNGERIRKDVTTEELIEVFAEIPMDFAPGQHFNYSNSGYILLGAIIEKVSGQSYADFIQTAIFDELEMDHSYYGGLQLIPNRAIGYSDVHGEIKNAGFISMTQPHGAGALLSTVGDLAKWNSALFSGELLSPESLEKMTARFELNNGEMSAYGYGFGLGNRFGAETVAHNGGIHGFATSAIWLPEHQVYVAVLSNFENSPHPDFLATSMALDAAGIDYPVFVAIEMDSSEYEQYVGVYQINDHETRSVLLEDGKIFTKRSGGPTEVLPYSKDRFFYPGSFTHLVFVRDESGRVSGMEMHHDGSEEAEPAQRISDSAEESEGGAE